MNPRSHYVVAFERREHMDNFHHLPPFFSFQNEVSGKIYQVTVHDSPRINVNDRGAVCKNFDILIAPLAVGLDGSKDWYDLLDQKTELVLRKRYSKSIMASLAIAYARKEELLHFLQVPAFKLYGDPVPDRLKGGYYADTDPLESEHYSGFVLKPEYGARSIGHVVIPNGVSVTKTACDLVTNAYKPQDTNPDDQLNEPANSIKEYSEKDSGAATYHAGFEQYKGEGLENLRNQGFSIQRRVTGITEEYRLFNGVNGEIKIALKRDRVSTGNNEDYKQATGVKDIPELVDPQKLPHIEEIKRFASNLDPLSSIDLFYTQSGKWGIFEWSNQFGTVGIDVTTVRDMHVDYIRQLILQREAELPRV